MKKIFSFLLFSVCTTYLSAQQLPQYSQWTHHQFAMNPAHAGIKQCLDLHTLYRAQWVGIDGAPQSGFVTASVPLKSRRTKFLSARHGMGAKFEADRIGQMGTNRFNLAYAGHFNFNENNRLSLGIYAGLVQFGYNHAQATTITPDPTVMREMTIVRPDAHFGAWWNSKNYYLGFMANQLIVSKWEIGYNSKFRFHFALNGGYKFDINDNVSIIPNAMLRIPVVGPVNADLIVNVDFRNTLNVGVGFRTKDAVMFNIGFKINEQFSLQYMFDYTVSGLSKVSNNTHEIGLSFITCKPISTSTSRCALFF